MMKSKINSSWIFLVLLLLLIGVAISLLFPWRVAPATAALDKFSGKRALTHLPIIAREPHPSGSPAQARVRDYLVQQLTDLGLEVEVQQEPGVENVLARLKGTDSSGAVLLQSHYDSYGGSGAADNGSGVSTLLEIARAISSDSKFKNDIILLFDDGEEMPDAFTGTKAFIRKHPWFEDVRVAIGMDTAVHGFISIVDTGPNNGWIVKVLARVHPVGIWTSLSGGGGYDTKPFRDVGVRVVEFEDNYPFHEQHTSEDTPEIVNPGTVQQLGNQVLAVVHELGYLDLNHTSGKQLAYVYIPGIGLTYYRETLALLFAVMAGVFFLVTIVFAFIHRFISWRGMGLTFIAMTLLAVLAAIGASIIWKAAPEWFGWETQRWSEWPEVIPPNGWWITIGLYMVVLILTVMVYRFIRRWTSRVSFSIFGLLIFLLLAVVLAVIEPRGSIFFTWPVLIGSAAWLAAMIFSINRHKLPEDVCVLIAALPTIFYLLPLMISIFMSDGTKSVAVTAAVWVFILGIILPVVDGLLSKPVPIKIAQP